MPRGVTAYPETNKLNQKQNRFARVFAEPGAKGHNKVTAYIDAGYNWEGKDGKPAKWLTSRAYNVWKAPNVQAEIAKLEAEEAQRSTAQKDLLLETIRYEHWQLYARALKEGNLSEARQNVEALGRTIAAYVDRTEIDIGRQREYTEDERAQVLAIARAVLAQGHDQAQALPMPDAAQEAVSEQPRATQAMLIGQYQAVAVPIDETQAQALDRLAGFEPDKAPAPYQTSPCPGQAPDNNTTAQEDRE